MRLLPVLALTWVACGASSGTMQQANTLYFWKVTSSDVVFGACSDNANFRAGQKPIEFTDKTYFAYKVDSTGKKATAQNCTARDASACTATTTVFDITGNQLVTTSSSKAPIPGSTCSIADLVTTTATDSGNTGTLELMHTYSLVDDQAACDSIDNSLKTQSPNGLGIQGCVITFKLGLTKG
ncbi:MAG: hypothetical protein K1X89_17565 [Myxococcaceae bacterium]|nr:hypothetical protein [Myxococcaceae bacterium]